MSETETLKEALNDAGLNAAEFPNLLQSYEFSEDFITRARDQLQHQLPEDYECADVAVFGSVARREMTEASDFDFLVITYSIGDRFAEQKILELAENLRSSLPTSPNDGEGKLAWPGSTGLFGVIVPAQEFYQNVGLQADTNHSHSRRMLLLEESVSLARPQLHNQLLEVTLDRYLSCHTPSSSKLPRFLLNDILRYWHTIAVDYQAKIPEKPAYGIRHLKLRISRKLVFAASLAPLCLCGGKPLDEMKAFLLREFSRPALVRFLDLAQVFEGNQKALNCINVCMCVSEKFSDKLRDKEWRKTIEQAAKEERSFGLADYTDMLNASRKLQANLIELFSEPPLLEFRNKYMLF